MRAARWCFILFQLVWLNAVLPGHTRGIVTVPGSPSQASGAGQHACCPPSSTSSAPSDDEETPTPDRRSRCAVCFFAATMAAAAPLVSPLAPLHLSEILPTPTPSVAPSVDRPLAYLGRGPPGNC